MKTIRVQLPMIVLALASTLVLAGWAAPAAAQHEGHQGHEGHDQQAAGHDDHSHHQAPRPGRVEYRSEGGLSIPDVRVRTQDGADKLFFSDLVEDKVVAMNFVFTTCTTICPPLGANFGKLQELLGDKAGRDVHLISVSVDPVTDTPERLKAWGDVFGAGPGWTLVTGDKDQITRLLKSLQVFTPDIRDHSPVLIMGNAAKNEWTRAYGLAAPTELAGMLEKLVAGEPVEEGR